MQDRLEKNEKSQNQFQNGLMRVKRNTSKKKDSKLRQNFSQTKRIQNIAKNILQNIIEQIKKKTNVLQDEREQSKKD